MKKIAITQRLFLNDKYNEYREGLDIQWGLLFRELHFLPINLPLEYNFKNYFDSIDIDGILLTGGNDLDSVSPSFLSGQRDEFEKNLIEYGIKNNIPIFGVCRGMQIIAAYFGADLKSVEGQVDIHHGLVVNTSSKYVNELKKINQVNSFHNYEIHTLSSDFVISARNEEGIIKAIEHTEHRIFAQMWHTEREKPFCKNQLALIQKFFDDEGSDLEFEI